MSKWLKREMRVEAYEKEMRKYTKEMAKLTIDCAKKTGWLCLPIGLFGGLIPLPLKWFPKLEKKVKGS